MSLIKCSKKEYARGCCKVRAWMVITENSQLYLNVVVDTVLPFFHQGDDGSRWTSASEFRKSTELSDIHTRKDGRAREKLVEARHWINHKPWWTAVPKLLRVYSDASYFVQRMKREPRFEYYIFIPHANRYTDS